MSGRGGRVAFLLLLLPAPTVTKATRHSPRSPRCCCGPEPLPAWKRGTVGKVGCLCSVIGFIRSQYRQGKASRRSCVIVITLS
ncbi:hypothetical protein scyTo_0003816 [Scyliorhinus torazame]|uniref:Secreted protein n=1 Tax=Scyliorhinus torazame TaxID=75743 RepID=A0A401PNN9_SCYTO|nr:hypothetical protein [Scyliorhinus torazame]